MITGAQQDYIEEHAYVPEHLPHYVSAISKTEPFLFEDYLAYVKQDHLIFVGYPLRQPFEEKRMRSALDAAIKRFKPDTVSLIAPSVPLSLYDSAPPSLDHYYRLDLSGLTFSQKLRNMLNRAGREVSVAKSGHFGKEHRKLIDHFLETHSVDEGTRSIFNNIEVYLSSSATASIFNAKNSRDDLIAFDIAEFKPTNYAIYMFNFRSDVLYVPGTSDLLLFEVIKEATAVKKKYINLGLGINPGVTFFKTKWGGTPFISYCSCLYQPPRVEVLDRLLHKL